MTLEVVGGEPPKVPAFCPLMSKAIVIPVQHQGIAPAGMQAVAMQTQVLSVPCTREGCQLWDYETEDCGLKETRKCPTN
jgi:hypothetical protein